MLSSGQHVALHDPNPTPDIVGYIDTKMSPVEVATNASENACSICLQEHGSAPDVNIYGDLNFTFLTYVPYVPPHLHSMVFELVKDSLRAVQERYMDSDKVPPPIRKIVADGLEDVTIKVSDGGGGIPRSGLPRIFTYLYSTAKNPLDEHEQPDMDLKTQQMLTSIRPGWEILKNLCLEGAHERMSKKTSFRKYWHIQKNIIVIKCTLL